MMNFTSHNVYQLDDSKFASQAYRDPDDMGDAGHHAKGTEFDKAMASRLILLYLKNHNYEQVYFTFRELIDSAARMRSERVELSINELMGFNNFLANELRYKPDEFLATFQEVLNAYAKTVREDISELQAVVTTNQDPITIRKLDSSLMGQLVCVSGVITACSRASTKARVINVQCHNCYHNKRISVNSGLGGLVVPRVCEQSSNTNKCPLDSYRVVPYHCDFIDTQTLKLQETPEDLPTGEIPRTFLLQTERSLIDQMQPGHRVNILGILKAISRGDNRSIRTGIFSNTKTSYLRVVGFSTEATPLSRLMPKTTKEEEDEIKKIANKGSAVEMITKSIAPSIYGSEDIKRAIACLLFSGSTKYLPDGMRLRGDINVLLLGDPSTAKSQFLKFVERVAPISVYTSGKGSSAAGLTASILRDPSSGQFQLEGGAMVLADGGVVCIDQFDKMRSEDRVAIHEAMEQQTISIAKAGITTVLNSRCSVLAAANPVAGFYESFKAAAEQIEFQSTILSRFDCIFIVKDERNEERDRLVAQHVIEQHKRGNLKTAEAKSLHDNHISAELLKKYISTARAKCAPRLSERAGEILSNFYVNDRDQNKAVPLRKQKHIPITVRQLEALVRISEAFAKMELKDVVDEHHVSMAHQLFRDSTLTAAKGVGGSDVQFNVGEEEGDEKTLTQKIQDSIRRRFPIGQKMKYSMLAREMNDRYGSSIAVSKAIHIMVMRGEMEQQQNRDVLRRIK